MVAKVVRAGNFTFKLVPFGHVTISDEPKSKQTEFHKEVERKVIMSLFKSKEYWAINLNENELYDSQSLLTITLEDEKFQSILVGNHKGVLRLFSPNSELEGGHLEYKPSHLLLEVQLPSPILQIKEGALVSGSSNIYLAVLHPRQFSVYTIKKKESKESNLGDQMEVKLVYQHVLRHSAHSFVLGPFGGVRGRSFICIQSLDGLLSFYEQESFTFQIYLPTFILPFTFYYLERIDSFLFLNGSLVFDCISYEALASAKDLDQKKIMKTWEFNLGEGILDINVVAKESLLILILSERNLYGLNENGRMISMRRLEYKPVAFYSYLTDESNVIIIVATEGGFLNIYEDTHLKWSMKIDLIPVAIKRIFLKCLPGGIILLSEDGFLQTVYIGTHPSVYLVPPLIQPDLDLQKAESELQELQRKIADNDIVEPITADLVGVDLKIDKTAELQNGIRKCNIILEIRAQCLVSRIQVLLIVEPPLMVTNQSTTILNCCDKTFVESTASVKNSDIASSLVLQVIVTYVTSEGVIRSIQKNGFLPLQLVVSEISPEKECQHKITITINKPVCGVNELFREFLSADTFLNAIGFKFLNSEDVVTILAAKSSQKYRLQADSLALITLLLQALLERLKIYFQKDSEFRINFSGSLPLDDFFKIIFSHQELIKKQKNLETALSKQTSQYITFQKKILINLKDTTPKSSNLYGLLKDTSNLIKTSLNELRAVEKELSFSRSSLRSMNRLMLILLELMSIRKEDLKILKIVFNPYVQDAEEHGWLEVQEVAISFLLRTALAKSVKDQLKPYEILLEPIQNVQKLTKHFMSVIERVTKGTYLLERDDFENKKEPLKTIQATYESDESFFDDVIPATPKLLKVNSTKLEKILSKSKVQSELGDLPMVEEKDEETKKNEREMDFSDEKPLVKPQVEKQTVQESEPEHNETENNDEYEDDDGIWDVKVGEMRI